MNLEKLRFPIGEFHFNPDVTEDEFENCKITIKEFPQKVNEIITILSVEELNWKYRPKGWTIKQVVHHCADSHMNALIRIKLTLTEVTPTIRPYEEQLWAELADGINDDVSASIKILEGIHQRWTMLLNTMTKEDFDKMYFHPANQKLYSLKEALGLYAWHCEHHLAHIHQAIQYKGMF